MLGSSEPMVRARVTPTVSFPGEATYSANAVKFAHIRTVLTTAKPQRRDHEPPP